MDGEIHDDITDIREAFMNAENQRIIPSVASYHLLGRSGLRVSPLCLGAMTFGEDWQMGANKDQSRKVFDRYTERGGNFIDTADGYTEGKSEELLGKFMKEMKNRDALVLASKYTFSTRPGDSTLSICGISDCKKPRSLHSTKPASLISFISDRPSYIHL